MTTDEEALFETQQRMQAAAKRYGDFSSSHEALGVLTEEMYELTAVIRANAIEGIREEALDVAAVALRLAAICRSSEIFKRRSIK